MKMKSFIFLIILAVSLNSCLNTQRDVVRCEKYSRMILGEWISVRNSSVTMKILSDTMIFKREEYEDEEFGYIPEDKYVNRINIVNELELKDCNDNDYEMPFDDYEDLIDEIVDELELKELKDCNDNEMPFDDYKDLIDEPLGPSKLRILEFEDNGNRVDTFIWHIIFINSEEMVLLSENGHSFYWKRKKSNIQDSNFIQGSGTAIEMD